MCQMHLFEIKSWFWLAFDFEQMHLTHEIFKENLMQGRDKCKKLYCVWVFLLLFFCFTKNQRLYIYMLAS
jgi:hypothetical protein